MTKPKFKHDLTLKFTDEAQAIEALSQFRSEDEEGNQDWKQGDHTFALVYCGDLHNNDAVLDEQGEVITPATPIEGYHINLQSNDDALSEALEGFKVFPKDRKVGWAR